MTVHRLFQVVVLAGLAFYAIADQKAGSRNGEFVQGQEDARVWHQASKKWLSPDEFWLAYAQEDDGLTWGRSKEYPAYEKVKEYDTMLIQVDKGDCLMEFYHQRWRRANDVRRWDPLFNEYSGCPYVFD